MKVLFISHEDSKFGAPKSLMELMRTLKDEFEVQPLVLLHSKDDVYDFCKKEGIEAHIVGHYNIVCGRKIDIKSYLKLFPKFILNMFYDFFALIYIKKNIDISTIDIIHSNVTITSLGEKISKLYKKPHIVHLRETAKNVEDYLMVRNQIIMLKSGAESFIAISNFNRDGWVDHGLDENRIEVIYNGLALKNEYVSPMSPDGDLKIIFSGAITREKGQLILVKAIAMLPKEVLSAIKVDIVGTGDTEYIRELRCFINKNGLEENIVLKGYVDNISKKYNKYNVGIVASRNEAFGRVTVEYMASGLCVIASNSGANPELIIDNENGMLFETDNPESLASKIIYLYENRECISALGTKAYQTAHSKFTTEINAANIYNHYLRVLGFIGDTTLY